jgi:tol-pal system protein YbgF
MSVVETGFGRIAVIRRFAFVAALLILSGPARAASKEVDRLQTQMSGLQGQLLDLQRAFEDSQRELRRLNEALAELNLSLKKSLQDQRIQSEATAATMKDLTDRVAEIGERVRALKAAPAVVGGAETPPGVSGGAGGPAAPGTPPAASPPAPRELYSQAYADYARGNYDLATQEFQDVIRLYPTESLAGNAQYWVGECLYGKQKYAEAVEAWNSFFRDYPSSEKLPDARYKKGVALEKLGRRSQAMVEWRYVVDRFPNTPAAQKAREKLTPR